MEVAVTVTVTIDKFKYSKDALTALLSPGSHSELRAALRSVYAARFRSLNGGSGVGGKSSLCVRAGSSKPGSNILLQNHTRILSLRITRIR